MLIKFQPLGPTCGRQQVQRTRRGSPRPAQLRAGRGGAGRPTRAEDANHHDLTGRARSL